METIYWLVKVATPGFLLSIRAEILVASDVYTMPAKILDANAEIASSLGSASGLGLVLLSS